MKKLFSPTSDCILELSSTAFLQKKLIIGVNNYFYIMLANFYIFTKLVLMLSMLTRQSKKKDYVWRAFVLVYINNLITLLFLAEYTGTLLPNGNIFIFMHLMFIDIIKKCVANQNFQLDCVNHVFFTEPASKLPADNYTYSYDNSCASI